MAKLLSVFLFLFFLFANSQSVAFAQSELPVDPATGLPGQIIELDFRIPGIGSESGNLNPLTPTRNVILNFFGPDVNSSDPGVKPLVTINTQATYDSVPSSPFFGSFINRQIDLSAKFPDGKYQISFKTEKALSLLMKVKESDVGGKVYEIKGTRSKPIILSGRTVIIGDIYPQPTGDNLMDMNDHNALASCFGAKADEEDCVDKNAPDLNDDGTVDGSDYNLMFSSFRTLQDLGLPVPSMFSLPTNAVSPVTKPSDKPTAAPSSRKAPDAKSLSTSIILIILSVLIIIGVLVFIFFKRKNVKGFLDVLLRKHATDSQKPTEQAVEENIDEPVDKEFFVKKQADDPENKRTVLTLTDDNGPTLGYYSGPDIKDGFANVKGVLKKEGNKVFIEVSEIKPEEESAT